MSRIGKKPIVIPDGVTVTMNKDSIAIKGPKGVLNRNLPPNVQIKLEKNEIQIETTGTGRKFGAFHGLARALLANMVTGVSEGFKKDLTLVGVGYRVALQDKKLVFNLGYSHPVEFTLPNGIEADIGEKGVVFSIKGIDRELVGQTCATIRGFRPPEPYKGKGIRYKNEIVKQKAGKASVK
ncbi:MAG: 50S ribosomal protein L6 [Proteobacteria bacterium]|nr:50S ribosomal protein L6 [Pseudomonadota bacterium]